jgi:outer membrane lipoprotein SlyB
MTRRLSPFQGVGGNPMLRTCTCIITAAALVAGCASAGGASAPRALWTPQVDNKHVDQARLQKDVAECNDYARANPDTNGDKAAKKTATKYGLGTLAFIGVATVLTGGLAAAAVLPAVAGDVALVSGGAALAGGSGAKMEANLKYQSIVDNCLSGRGYKVLG